MAVSNAPINATEGSSVAILQKAQWLKSNTADEQWPNQVASHFWPGGIAITARLQETYTFQAEVTRLAVENGSQISEHVIIYPARVDLSFEVNNWEGYSKPKKALADFITLQYSRKIFDLLTEHRLMKNMVCYSIQADNSVPEWGKLAFRASFQQINFATLQTTAFPVDKVAADPVKTGGPATSKRAESPINRGTQVPKGIFDNWVFSGNN